MRSNSFLKKKLEFTSFVLLMVCLLGGCVYIQAPLQITHEFDNFIVMRTPRALVDNSDLGRRQIARTLYGSYADEFDWIIVLYNVSREQQQWKKLGFEGRCTLVRNSIAGDGAKDLDIGGQFGSRSKLKAMIELPTKEPLIEGLILHEIMHSWVFGVDVIPSNYRSHWGFSSVHGKLGGFDKDTLENIGENIYSVGSFSPRGATNHRSGYGELELYLAGWITKEEVSDILVAEGVRPMKEGNLRMWIPGRIENFEASRFTTWTIDQIIDSIGERIPNVVNSQKHFRMATVVIENEKFPFLFEDIKYFQRQIDLFTRQESILHVKDNRRKLQNFWEATGGRATVSATMVSARFSTSQPP